jgi:quinohemoprotein ethanol dehydrogenase
MRKTLFALMLTSIALLTYFAIEQGMFSPSLFAPSLLATQGSAEEPNNRIGLIDDARINNHNKEPGNWLAHGRTYEEQRFSPLTQINRDTVQQLGLAWYRDMGTNRTQEATPIVVDGVMFLTSAWSKVFAIKATTGEPLWQYDPKVPGEWGRRACCDVVNRGVAVYNGRVYVGSLDGRLIALDATTGEELWQVDTLIDRERFYTITGAPRVANGKVYIGNGGAEFGVRGYVTAYDAKTGEQAWRFFTVPGDPNQPFEHPELEMAAATWKGGKWWEYGGGGTVWNSIVYDPDFNHLYIGVGNGAPWTRVIRSPGGGDNLFLSSIVALDADTGKMKWYYQTTPGDNWDYTATQDIALADWNIDGKQRKVLLQAPKNGFFYVLDRADGQLLRAHPYSAVTWATHVDMQTGRPVENPELDYLKKAKWVLPGSSGAHNWQAMSVDVDAGVVYIPTQITPLIFGMADEWKKTGAYQRNPGRWNNGLDLGGLAKLFLDNIADAPEAGGYLKAFDPITGEDKWAVKNAYYWNGGVLATAGGLVFQGDSQGMVNAYDKTTGERLWQFNTSTSMLAPPVTFEIDSVQYVSILTGGGGADLFGGEVPTASTKYGNFGRLLVFKIGGKEKLPAPTVRDRQIPELPALDVADTEIEKGERFYGNFCAACHGLFARSGGSIPDLRLIDPGRRELFKQIVLEGLFASRGMASFSDVLSEQDVQLIDQYIRARAAEDRDVAQGKKSDPRLTWISD